MVPARLSQPPPMNADDARVVVLAAADRAVLAARKVGKAAADRAVGAGRLVGRPAADRGVDNGSSVCSPPLTELFCPLAVLWRRR